MTLKDFSQHWLILTYGWIFTSRSKSLNDKTSAHFHFPRRLKQHFPECIGSVGWATAWGVARTRAPAHSRARQRVFPSGSQQSVLLLPFSPLLPTLSARSPSLTWLLQLCGKFLSELSPPDVNNVCVYQHQPGERGQGQDGGLNSPGDQRERRGWCCCGSLTASPQQTGEEIKPGSRRNKLNADVYSKYSDVFSTLSLSYRFVFF